MNQYILASTNLSLGKLAPRYNFIKASFLFNIQLTKLNKFKFLAFSCETIASYSQEFYLKL